MKPFDLFVVQATSLDVCRETGDRLANSLRQTYDTVVLVDGGINSLEAEAFLHKPAFGKTAYVMEATKEIRPEQINPALFTLKTWTHVPG